MINCDLQKLDILGASYLFQFATQHAKEEVYRVYMANVSRLILKATARLGDNEVTIPTYYDIIHPKNEPEQSTEAIKQGILDEFRKIGGANTDGSV